MDRRAWLATQRRTTEERHDTIHAFTYDEQFGEITPTHRRFVTDLLERCPPGGTVLDAGCGTGKYFGLVLEAGRRVVGVDQSTGMLQRARARFPDVPLERLGLQELAFDGEFDAVMCVDAMENVPPEDWPTVVGNLRRALRPGGHLYLTVEEVDEAELDRRLAEATARGLPVVRGEDVGAGGGYHYYPSRAQVAGWLADAGLTVVAEDASAGDGYGYLHLLARRADDPARGG